MAFNHEQTEKEHLMTRIRYKLQQDQIKLWLSPYLENDSLVEEALEELASNYSNVMAIPKEDVLNILKTLQVNAIDKLAARSLFQKKGLATVRVKIVGTQQVQDVVISLQETGQTLREKILQTMTFGSRLKLICNGIILRDDVKLEDQRVSNSSQILALSLSSDLETQRVEEEIIREVQTIKTDAELLASKQDEDSYLRIADQSGKLIELPPEEKKSLAIALALHEKGRSALKRNQVPFALMLFHEADCQFASCRSDILSAVDNVGLVNLDIVWCYLLLGSAADIPDADTRLERCEKTLAKSYGPQMERLLTLKGTTGNEAVLFVRLHLLQGVVAYHQGKSLDASQKLTDAKSELSKLLIQDDDLAHLVALGYTVSEARLGLRATRNDVNQACLYLEQRRDEKEKRIEREKEEEKLNRERKKMGKTVNGNWVNFGYLSTLQNMGYDRYQAIDALKQTNNDLSQALDWIESRGACSFYNEESVAQVASVGCSVEEARELLDKYGGDVSIAMEKLASDASGEEKASGSSSKRSRTEKDREEKEAYQRLSHDLPTSEDDHLDANLEIEATYLDQYLRLIKGAI